MATLLKYFMGIAIILPATVILCAVNMGELFVGFSEVAQTPAKEAPSWKIERLKAEPDTPYVARGSLSPIYPATPGKEIFGKPIYTARLAKKLQLLVSTKRIDVRQALKLHNVLRQIYAEDEENRNFPQLSLSYTEARPSQLLRSLQPRMPIIFGHGIY
jgi:hypothetical protein